MEVRALKLNGIYMRLWTLQENAIVYWKHLLFHLELLQTNFFLQFVEKLVDEWKAWLSRDNILGCTYHACCKLGDTKSSSILESGAQVSSSS
jgi:hypothetical protein